MNFEKSLIYFNTNFAHERTYVWTWGIRVNPAFASPSCPVYHISLCPLSLFRLQEHWALALPRSAVNTAKSFILTQKVKKSLLNNSLSIEMMTFDRWTVNLRTDHNLLNIWTSGSRAFETDVLSINYMKKFYGFWAILWNFRLDLQKPRPRPRSTRLDKHLEVTKVEDTGSYRVHKEPVRLRKRPTKDHFVQFTSSDHPPGPWNVRLVVPGLMTDIYRLLEIDETWNNWR